MEKDVSQDTAWTGVGGGQGVREHQLISFSLSFYSFFVPILFILLSCNGPTDLGGWSL